MCCAVPTLVIQTSIRAVHDAENYLHAVSIHVKSLVMKRHVRRAHCCRRFVKRVLAQKQSLIINNEHHVLIQYVNEYYAYCHHSN
jgi:sulfur relay (sulfurtransferase) DsrC/TusE family protein